MSGPACLPGACDQDLQQWQQQHRGAVGIRKSPAAAAVLVLRTSLSLELCIPVGENRSTQAGRKGKTVLQVDISGWNYCQAVLVGGGQWCGVQSATGGPGYQDSPADVSHPSPCPAFTMR